MKTILCSCLAIVLLGFVAGCRTTSIENVKRIMVPQNLTLQETKFAIARSVAPETAPDGWKNWEKITDAAIGAAFGARYQRQHQYNGAWYVESVEPKAVVFGFTNRGYYLRVRMTIDGGQIVPVIEDSNGLRQSENSIHKNAVEWINRLEIRMRSSLGAVSSYKASMAERQAVDPSPAARKL